ncbi:MAG: hypothetical protein Q9174_006782 [Haloplaca sp. 1 TL-2023]
MAETHEPALDEIRWSSPPYAQSMGGIHTNTAYHRHSTIAVLPYFYISPFFDVTSNNNTINTQAQHNPAQSYLISTRAAFEDRLRTMQGLEFMVAHDPSENGTKFDHTGIWVIRKQVRRKKQEAEDEVTAISSYYIVGENIYMATTVGHILGARLLSTISLLNRTIATASVLPTFTPALGHTYLPPAPKPLTSTINAPASQTSKESTPMPGTQESIMTKVSMNPTLLDHDFYSNQLLEESFSMSIRYRHEYMDESPLIGEPGSFKMSKTREAQQQAAQPKAKPAGVPAKPPTPQIKTDVADAKRKDGVGAEKSPISPFAKVKKARRKSKPAGSPTTPKTPK